MAARSVPYFLRRNDSVYYFRTRVPTDLQEWLQRRELPRSLKTNKWSAHTAANQLSVPASMCDADRPQRLAVRYDGKPDSLLFRLKGYTDAVLYEQSTSQ